MQAIDTEVSQRLIDLPEELLDELERQQRKEMEKREHQDPANFFPWHRIQTWVLESPSIIDKPIRVMLLSGGNRSGKSATMKGLWSRVLRRDSALNDQFMELNKRTKRVQPKAPDSPLVTWVVPPTLEKGRQDWLAPEDGYSMKHWAGDLFVHHREQPDNVMYTKVPGVSPWHDKGKYDPMACDRTLMKSMDQKLESFESSAVDLALIDEEINSERKWNSILMRIGTTNGLMAMAFTPLHGLSWSWDRYWAPLVEGGRADKVSDRCWVHQPNKGAVVVMAQMGTADNPLAKSYADEVEADAGMSRAEKNARLYGEYGYVEGALIERLAGLSVRNPLGKHEQYVVDELPERKAFWFTVADPNKSFGATLSCLDEDGNLFFVAEHLEQSLPNREHANRIKAMERTHIPPRHGVLRYADPGSAGAQATIDLTDAGIPFMVMPKGAGSVSASIKALRNLAAIDPKHVHPITGDKGAPRVYFYRPGLCPGGGESQLAKQIGQARQTDDPSAPPDTPHKSNRYRLDLFDCGRYTAMLRQQYAASLEDDGVKANVPADRMPTDKDEWDRMQRLTEEESHEEDFFLPEYSF